MITTFILRAQRALRASCAKARGGVSGVVGWLCAQLEYWPGLAYALSRIVRFARVMIAGFRTGAGWVRMHISPIVAVCASAMTAATGAAAAAIATATISCCRLVWGVCEQPIRDAAGWLVHTFPRLAVRIVRRLTSRFVRWLPTALARVFKYSAIGAALSIRHVCRYCLGFRDFAARIEAAEQDGYPDRAAKLRHRWRVAALRRTACVLSGVVGFIALVSVAVTAYGATGAWLMLMVLVGVAASIGRTARPPRGSAEPVPGETEAEEGAPFPLADAHTRAEAADAAARALCAEGIELRMTNETARTAWGWEVGIMLRRGTPAAATAKTGELETHLDLPAGGVLVTPDRSRRAHVTLRLAMLDPFIAAPSCPHRPPHSSMVSERAVIGSRIDGQALAVPLLGVHGVVIGAPGSGKSTTLAALAEAITAAEDATVWDLDPAGLGLESLATAVSRRERDANGIEDALADALALAESRPRLLGQLGMGSAWQPSRERPAVVVVVDEYPRLSDLAKELAVALLRVGRKARVTLILAATEATSDALGASIAELAALKILHSCRSTDVRLVLGPNMAAEGWRPDRLHPATADDPGDVGKCYVSTAGMREPLIAKVHDIDPNVLGERARERAEAGMPRIDAESWQAARSMRASHGDEVAAPGQASAGSSEQVDHQAVTDILAVFVEDARLWTSELLVRLSVRDPQRYGQWGADTIAITLRPLGVTPVQIKRDGTNRNGYDRDAIAEAYRAHLGGARP